MSSNMATTASEWLKSAPFPSVPISSTPRAGLAHIVQRHGDDFARAGIPGHQIPNAVRTAVESGRIVGFQGSGVGRPVFEFEFNGVTRRMAVTISSNGFIVGANPVSLPRN